LIRGFFNNVSVVLESNGQVILIVLCNQRKTWDLEAIAAEAGFELVETMKYAQGVYETGAYTRPLISSTGAVLVTEFH
jgi:hypothetical protein